MLFLNPTDWQDYQLLDSGDFERLERFGPVIVRRPEPQALWPKALAEPDWKKAQAVFKPDGETKGSWLFTDQPLPTDWTVTYRLHAQPLHFRLTFTKFKHVGLFPEQAVNWRFIYDASKAISKPKILNLFAYTGGASFAARAAGAEVTHCDALKQLVTWARENMEKSGLTDIRWIVEDVVKFVKREIRRGNRYDGIILDPPAFGRGPKGEKWQLESDLDPLVADLAKLLKADHGFLVLNTYSLGFSSVVLENLLRSHFPRINRDRIQSGEIFLRDSVGRRLPTGIFGRIAGAS